MTPPSSSPSAAPEEIRPLTDFPAGTAVQFVTIDAGYGLRERLLAMGFVPGAVGVIISQTNGPVTVCVNDCRVALGRGIAARLLGRAVPRPPCNAECEPPCNGRGRRRRGR